MLHSNILDRNIINHKKCSQLLYKINGHSIQSVTLTALAMLAKCINKLNFYSCVAFLEFYRASSFTLCLFNISPSHLCTEQTDLKLILISFHFTSLKEKHISQNGCSLYDFSCVKETRDTAMFSCFAVSLIQLQSCTVTSIKDHLLMTTC